MNMILKENQSYFSVYKGFNNDEGIKFCDLSLSVALAS